MDKVEKNLIKFKNDLQSFIKRWRNECRLKGYANIPIQICNTLVALERELKFYNYYNTEED